MTEAPPLPDLGPLWSHRSSDLHLSCCSVRLGPVGGEGPLLQILLQVQNFIPFAGDTYLQRDVFFPIE